ncbi:methyltransferase domain-containing protein [Candidatus Berkelbacteria bacterium]|nr:methyltransferase domain-containing protein [Candidatus Berkelbacteria bacterium]
MLEKLKPEKGERILDIGAGSGYTTALLGFLVGENGTVVALERIKKLKEKASQNISHYSFIKRGRVKLILGNGTKGRVKEAPFDKILASATASKIPVSWKEQLKVGGRIVAPVLDTVQVWEKRTAQKFKVQTFPGFLFVPLI